MSLAPPARPGEPHDDDEKPSRARLVVLLLVLAVLLVLAARRFGHGILYRFRHVDPKIVPHTGASVLPVERHTHAPGAMRETRGSVSVAGQARTYIELSPIAVKPGVPLPLVLVLHGDGGSADSFHNGTFFERATGDEAIVVYPDGLRSTWDLDSREDNPDVAFLEEIVKSVALTHEVDRARVFGTGYSSGGFLVNVAACERPDLFRAIASSAGGAPYSRAEKWPNGFAKCKGQRPVPMLALHGTHDFGVSLDSGAFSAQYWAYVNGCDTGLMETTEYPECHAYKCPKEPAAFCKIEGLGHWVWDRAPEASWTFFLRAPPR